MSETLTQQQQSSGSTTEQVKERVEEGAQQVKTQTRQRVREQVDNRSTQTGEQMTRTAAALRQTAQQLRSDQQESPANLLEGLAERAERLGSYLTAGDGDRLLRDVERFARRQPWVIAGGGAVVGFFAARFMKASSSRRYEADRDGGYAQTQQPRGGGTSVSV